VGLSAANRARLVEFHKAWKASHRVLKETEFSVRDAETIVAQKDDRKWPMPALTPASVFLELSANIGFLSIALSSLTGCKALVLSESTSSAPEELRDLATRCTYVHWPLAATDKESKQPLVELLNRHGVTHVFHASRLRPTQEHVVGEIWKCPSVGWYAGSDYRGFPNVAFLVKPRSVSHWGLVLEGKETFVVYTRF
jgi:hypothetical protein